MNKITQPRLMIVQYGDYRAALDDRSAGIKPSYRAVHYIMDTYVRASRGGPWMIVSVKCSPYDEQRGNCRLVGGAFAPSGVHGWRYRWRAWRSAKRLIALARRFQPTHLLLRSCDSFNLQLGLWAIKQGIQVLPVWAQYFHEGSRDGRHARKVVRLLTQPAITVCSDHNYPASRSIQQLGVPASKIVPWDYPPEAHPSDLPPRDQPPSIDDLRLVYCGILSDDKGVPDILNAIHRLKKQNIVARCELLGDGVDRPRYETMARDLGVNSQVTFVGRVAHDQVSRHMTSAHAVVVSSRPGYPEGLPNVVYEALLTRTPVVCSDHPMLKQALRDGVGCRAYKAGDASSLADALASLVAKPDMYLELSHTTQNAWQRIQCPVRIGDLINEWIDATCEGRPVRYLRNSLAMSPQWPCEAQPVIHAT